MGIRVTVAPLSNPLEMSVGRRLPPEKEKKTADSDSDYDADAVA